MRIATMLVAVASLGGAAHAEREFCPERPGRGTPACTVDPGTVQLETSLADYAHSRDADEVEDETLVGQSLLRMGVADHAELRLSWTPYGIDRTRDRGQPSVDHRRGVGDVTIGIKRNLAHPGGSGVSVAISPFVTLPVGHRPIGGGSWSAGVSAPVNADLDDNWSLTIDPEVDAAANQSGDGRHLAYSGVVDLQRKLGRNLSVTGEVYAQRDRDPMDHTTQVAADFAVARQFGENGQIDAAVYRGLNHQTPRYELILGFARRFR